MSDTVTGEQLANRVQGVIDGKFKGNVAAFGRACSKLDASVDDANIRSLLTRHSMPRFNIVSVFARASGVSLDWLAGIEKPQQEGTVEANLVKEAMGYNPRSVQFEPLPPDHTVLPGFAIGAPGHEQLVVDFLVKGKEHRHTIPFQEHRTKGEKEL